MRKRKRGSPDMPATIAKPARSVQNLLPPSDLSISACIRLAARRLNVPENTLRKRLYTGELTQPIEVLLEVFVHGGLLHKGEALTSEISRILDDAKLPESFDVALFDQQKWDLGEETHEEVVRWADLHHRDRPTVESRKALINALKSYKQASDLEVASKRVLRAVVDRRIGELQDELEEVSQ